VTKLYRAFYSQRCTARLRGIEFLLTFEEWLKIWIDSGHLPDRGRGLGKYCMARYGDVGPYAVGNLKVILHGENVSEGNKGILKSEMHKQNISKSLTGRVFSETHIQNMSICKMGKIQSAETIKKRSISMKGRPSHRKGKVIGPQSEEHIQKRIKSRALNKRKRVEV
jgi:hypothetical protein